MRRVNNAPRIVEEILEILDDRKRIKRCPDDLNGCQYFKTQGSPDLAECAGDGHYLCKKCVNLSVPLDRGNHE